MLFCEICDFMLYLKISPQADKETVIYFCRNCGVEKLVPSTQCLSKRVLKAPETDASVFSKHAKFDPTLPRIQMKCKTEECANTDIIYMRYDDARLKYAFLCPLCDSVWKGDSK